MLSEAQLGDIRRRNPVAEVAERLGARLKKRGRALTGTCPMCGGGKSAQRFEAKTAETWACAVCSDGGDVIRLVERALGISFLDAVEWLGGAQVLSPEEEARRAKEAAEKRARREAEAEKFREAERARLYRMWRASAPFAGTPVESYLRARGVDWLDGVTVRAIEATYFAGETQDERGRKVPRALHRGIAMLAPFVRGDGRFGGLHLTFLDAGRPGEKATIVDPDTGEALPAKKMRGSKAGAYLRICDDAPVSRLRIGEGIETVLSVRAAARGADGWAYWAAGDLGNLAGAAAESVPHPTLKSPNGRASRVPGPEPDPAKPGLPIPAGVEALDLLADGDSEPFLTKLAIARASKRYARPGRVVTATWAPEGADFNDIARGAA